MEAYRGSGPEESSADLSGYIHMVRDSKIKRNNFMSCLFTPGASLTLRRARIAKARSYNSFFPDFSQIPTEDEGCLEYSADLKSDQPKSGIGRNASSTSESGTRLQQRRHTFTRVPSTPRHRRYDDATINRGNAMLQAAVSLTFR